MVVVAAGLSVIRVDRQLTQRHSPLADAKRAEAAAKK